MGYVRKGAMFLLGGGAYIALELLWRGRSHVSMFAAGGLCLLLIGELEEQSGDLPLPVRMLVDAGVITLVELATGLLVNRDYHVWDYRSVPINFKGQICLPFSLLWVPVSWIGMRIYGLIENIN